MRPTEIPPALSTDPASANYVENYLDIGPWLDVRIDGEPAGEASEYSIPGGYIVRPMIGSDGGWMLDFETGKLAEQMHFGRVEVTLRHEPHSGDAGEFEISSDMLGCPCGPGRRGLRVGEQPAQLEWLPRPDWRACVIDEKTLALSIWGRRKLWHGKHQLTAHWQKWPMSAFPNPIVGEADLAALGVLPAFLAYAEGATWIARSAEIRTAPSSP